MIEIRTPARLHFGLLAYSRDDRRQFGGAGLMVHRPETLIRLRALREGEAPAEPVFAKESRSSAGASPSQIMRPGFTSSGRMGDRAIEFAKRFLDAAAQRGWSEKIEGLQVDVLRVPRPHTGLGSGTQLGMAVARGLCEMLDHADLPPPEMAAMVGRGQRSAIGVHGFFRGGFIVEGGKSVPDSLSPMLMHHPFPEEWRIVIIRPRALEGIAGEREHQAFTGMPSIPTELTARMCHLLMLSLTPALIEHDLDGFGESLFELQQMVGSCFASAQGGIYADPSLEQMVHFIRERGVRGVGQSSWGPTLYAISGSQDAAERLAGEVQSHFGLAAGEIAVTTADNRGASLRSFSDSTPSAHHAG